MSLAQSAPVRRRTVSLPALKENKEFIRVSMKKSNSVPRECNADKIDGITKENRRVSCTILSKDSQSQIIRIDASPSIVYSDTPVTLKEGERVQLILSNSRSGKQKIMKIIRPNV